MKMPEYDYETEEYFCNKFDGRVTIDHKYILHINAVSQEIDKREHFEFICPEESRCGVFDESGKPDWSQCPHPLSPKGS